jgi:tetratricopeptide (TPR) repeat protein
LAYESLKEGLKLIDENRDASLMMVASHNHLLFLVEKGFFDEAKIVLFKNRANLADGGRIAQLKLRGIEGEIYYGLGKLDRAELVFREVKQGFRNADLTFACALESLFLAMTLMRQGRHDEAIQEGLEATAAFIALSIHREVLGSVLFLEEAIRAKTATISLFEKTVRYLRRKQIEFGIE